MAEELISSYIDRSAIKADTDFLLTQLKSVADAYTSLSGSKVNLSFANGIQSTTSNLNSLNQSLKQTATASNQAGTAIGNMAKEQAAAAKAALAEQKINDQLSNDYLQLSKAYNDAALKYKNYALTLGANHPITLQAQQEAIQMGNTLKELDAGVGQYGRNVGNYSSAFQGYANTLRGLRGPTKLLGEALGFSATQADQFRLIIEHSFQGLAAIFRGKEAKAAAESADAAATTAATQAEALNSAAVATNTTELEANAAATAVSTTSVEANATAVEASAVAAGTASTAMRIFNSVLKFSGIGLAIAGIGYLVYLFLKAKDAVDGSEDAFRKSQDTLKVYNETLDKTGDGFAKAVEEVDSLRINIDLAKNGFLQKDDVLRQYNETIGKTTGYVKDLDEAEQQLEKNADAYIKFTLLKAAASMALQDAAKIAADRQKEIIEKQSSFDFNVRGQEGLSEALKNNQEYQKLNDQAVDELKKFGKASDETEKKLDALKNKISQGLIDPEKGKEQKTLEDVAKDLQQQAAELAKEFNFNFFGSDQASLKNYTKKFFADDLKEQEEELKKVSESETVYLNKRLEARQQAFAIEYKIIQGQSNAEIAGEKEKLNEVLNNVKSSTNERLNAQREYSAKVSDINEKRDFLEKDAFRKLTIDLGLIRRSQIDNDLALVKQEQQEIAEYDKKIEAARIKKMQDDAKKKQDQNSIERDDELHALDVRYQEGLIKEDEYQLERFKIEQTYSIKSQKILLDSLDDQIKLAKEKGQDTVALEKQIADAKAKIDEDLTNKLLENREKLKEKEREVATAVIGGIKQLVDDGYDRQKNALQDQVNAIDAKTQKEIDAVNQSVLSEQDKAAKIATINATANAQKQQLANRQKEEDVKKAQFDKLIAIFQIGVETTKTVTELTQKAALAKAAAAGFYASGNPIQGGIAAASAASIAAQIPLAIASGAIEAGLIAAQPIPKYKTGTSNHPGGPFYAGDGGRSEIVIGPDGTAFITPSVPTLYDMPQGTIVLPDANKEIEKSFNVMYKGVSPAQNQSSDLQIRILSKKLDAVINAIEAKPVANIKNTWRGVETSFENASRQWEYINRNTQS